MEQLYNAMLANMQMPQPAPAAQKGGTAQKDSFQKLLEQKQGADTQKAPEPEKTDAAQKPQEPQAAQSAGKPQDAEQPQQVQAGPKNGKELEEQMVLAAMAMMQNPVVPVEEIAAPEVQVQAEAVAAAAPVVVEEAVLAPETQDTVPKVEQTGEIPEDVVSQTTDQSLTEELPQAIEAPESVQETESRTVETKVEVNGAGSQDAEAVEGEDVQDPQGGEVETPVFEDVKAVPVKVGEAPAAKESAEVENIGEQIGLRMVEAVSVTGEGGNQSVIVYLDPANLGKVQIEVSLNKDGTLHVTLNAENSRTQNLLSRNSESLAAILGKYAQEEVRVEVPRQEESQRQDLYQQQQEHHQRRQQEERRKRETSGEDFLQQLRLGLVPTDGE